MYMILVCTSICCNVSRAIGFQASFSSFFDAVSMEYQAMVQLRKTCAGGGGNKTANSALKSLRYVASTEDDPARTQIIDLTDQDPITTQSV